MKQKNILFVYTAPWLAAVTGGQKYEQAMFDILASESDYHVTRLNTDRAPSKTAKLLSPLSCFRYLREMIRYDLVVFNSSKCIYFGLLSFVLSVILRKKTLVIHHHYLYREFSGIKKIIYRIAEFGFLKTASFILTPSPYIADLTETLLNKKPVLCPIPFDKKPGKESAPQPGNLLYIGTIEPRKGLSFLFASLRILKEREIPVKLSIIGKEIDADYAAGLKSVAEQHGLDVSFHGYIPQTEMERIMSNADVFVFPSLLEGFGMAINEAMVYALPVICFNNSAMPYSVENGVNGILVENKNSAAFAEAVQQTVLDRDFRDMLSRNAALHARKLPGKENFRQRIGEIFAEIL